MADDYTTRTLTRVVNSMVWPASHLLDTFFMETETSDTEEVSFDVEKRKNRISPLVSPLVEGVVVERQEFKTETFKPAYVKDKRQFDALSPMRRRIGEDFNGVDDPMTRRRFNLLRNNEDQLRMLTMREETFAAEILRTGKLTIAGKGFGTYVIDFQRDPSLTVAALVGNAQWSDTVNSTPLQDLEDWGALIQGVSGSVATMVTMEPAAWSAFRAHPEVKDVLDTRRGSESTAEIGPRAATKARRGGTIGDFDIWVYQESYVDADGNTQQLLQNGEVLLGSPEDIEGVRHYGAIKDEEFGYQPFRAAQKSWVEPDPSVRWMLLQSAPIVVPYRPNATLACAGVLG